MPASQAALAIQARRYQEAWLKQVRSLLRRFEAFRRTELQRKQRDDWPQALFTYLVAQLQGDPNLRSTTLTQHLYAIGARIPGGLPKVRASDMMKSFASLNLLRVQGLRRAVQGDIPHFLDLARTQTSTSLRQRRVLMACLLVSQGQRR